MKEIDMNQEEIVLGLPNLVLVIVEPETPGNVGFTARVMANFGVSELRLVGNDVRESPAAQIFAVRASEILDNAQVYPDLASALYDVENAWAATARSGSNHSVTRALAPITELPDPLTRKGKVALVFGRESIGLTNEELALCDLAYVIPTSPDYPSMNLSHAIAVSLYELYHKYAFVPERTPTDVRAASAAEKELVSSFFDELVDMTTIKDFRKPIAKQVLRNLIQRSFITGREIHTLAGTVRKLKALIDDNN